VNVKVPEGATGPTHTRRLGGYLGEVAGLCGQWRDWTEVRAGLNAAFLSPGGKRTPRLRSGAGACGGSGWWAAASARSG